MPNCVKCSKKLVDGNSFLTFPTNASVCRQYIKALQLPKDVIVNVGDVACTSHFNTADEEELKEIASGHIFYSEIESEANHSPYEYETDLDVQQESSQELNNEDEDAVEVEPGEVIFSQQTENADEPANVRVLNGLAVFACSVCPALFASKTDFDDHMAIRASSWNSKGHADHQGAVVKALRRLAKNPTNAELQQKDQEPPTVVKKVPDHTYASPKKRRRKKNLSGDDGDDEDEETVKTSKVNRKSLPETLFPNLIPRKTRRKPWRKTLRSSRRAAFDDFLSNLREEAEYQASKKVEPSIDLLPNPSGRLTVLKDGRIVREHGFIS